MPKITKACETCGSTFTAWKVPSKTEPRYCSQKCWLKKHNNPERNAKVARETAEKRGDKLRGRSNGGPVKVPRLKPKNRPRSGTGEGYVKLKGRHEHRVVMEQKLGRQLEPGEIVHHKDENKKNNHPDNLELTTRRGHIEIHRPAMSASNRKKNGIPDTEICAYCNNEFTMSTIQRFRKKKGQQDFYCSTMCVIKRLKGSGNPNYKHGKYSKGGGSQ